MLAVQPVCNDSRNKELRAVRSRTSISHRQHERLGVLQLEVLISELLAIDALATSAVSAGEVASLAHKILDNAVEARALVVKGLAGLAHALFASAQCTEVFGRLWNNICEEFEDNAASRSTADRNVKENPWIAHYDNFPSCKCNFTR